MDGNDKDREIGKDNKWGLNPRCGFYLPAGWEELVDKLIGLLRQIPDWDDKLVAQVKEKFGGLRFYIDPYIETLSLEEIELGEHMKYVDKWKHVTKPAQEIIDAAEVASTIICEICGQEGRRRKSCVVRCDKHEYKKE